MSRRSGRSMLAGRRYEKDVMIVEAIDMGRATRSEATRRRHHPLFEAFWDAGGELLRDGAARESRPAKGARASASELEPYVSRARDITIAAVQMACSRDVSANTKTILTSIRRAASDGADIVVFPELAVTGSRADDILAAERPVLDAALAAIRDEARARGIHAIVGDAVLRRGRLPELRRGHRG